MSLHRKEREELYKSGGIGIAWSQDDLSILLGRKAVTITL